MQTKLRKSELIICRCCYYWYNLSDCHALRALRLIDLGFRNCFWTQDQIACILVFEANKAIPSIDLFQRAPYSFQMFFQASPVSNLLDYMTFHTVLKPVAGDFDKIRGTEILEKIKHLFDIFSQERIILVTFFPTNQRRNSVSQFKQSVPIFVISTKHPNVDLWKLRSFLCIEQCPGPYSRY